MIKIMKKINIEKLIFLCTMCFLIDIPLMILISYTSSSFYFTAFGSFNRVYILWWALPVLFVLYILDIIFNKKKVTYIDILLYLLIILGVLSTIFAVNKEVSIYGAATRNEGLLSLLSYYFILLNFKNMSNEKYKNIIIKTIITLGIIQVTYGVLQVYTKLPFILHFGEPYMACGLSGHPNFFGSYMVILASFAFTMYMLGREKKYLVLSLIFFTGICLASSSGPFISFLLMVVFFTIYYRKKIKWKCLLKTLFIFVLIYFCIDFSVKYVHINIYKNKISTNSNISSELKNLNMSNLGNGRVNLWKDSLPLVKKYWVVGAGLDNFGQIYGVKNGVYFDKAHNVYLQIALTNGIFALAIYMILISIIFFKSLKFKEKIYISLLMAFIGYSIQAFANISVVEVAPTFFIICGILLGKIQKDNKEDVILCNN